MQAVVILKMTDSSAYMHGMETIPKTALTADPELVLLAQQGSNDAFSMLYRKYHGLAIHVAQGIVHNKETAKELVQEAALKGYTAIETYRGESQFQTWFIRIVTNVCIDYLRMRKKYPHVEFDETYICDGVQERYQRPERSTQLKEEFGVLEQILQQLSPHHRQVLEMREIQEMSYLEIAEALHIPEGTVMSRLFYARRRMREFMQEYFPEFVYGSLKSKGTVSEEPQMVQTISLPLEETVASITEQSIEIIVPPEQLSQSVDDPKDRILDALVWWQRQVYELFMAGQDYQQIAEQLRIPYHAVKLRMSDAKRKLKSQNLI